MAKKKTWFTLIKRLFISEPQSRLLEKKDKRRRWAFRLLKARELSWQKAQESAGDLPEMLQAPSNSHRHDEIKTESNVGENVSKHFQQHCTFSQDWAATKIQAAFRGYLARKALGALKGVVKLQALIRGWAVRRQAINTLKCLQSLVNIQTQVISKKTIHCQDHKSHDLREKDIKVDLNSQKRWDDSTLTKEELKALFLTKRDASIKRERSKDYYLNHRRSAETERDKAYGRRRYWLEQWVDAQLAKSGASPRNLDRTLSGNARNRDDAGGKMRAESPTYNPKRSYHHRKQRSIGDEHSFVGSPSLPAYMASTESAKARSRSMSSPRLRPLSFDVCSEITSPFKHKLSPISSINSELTSSSWIGNHVSSSQRSPRLKGPIKSTMSTKDLRLRGIYHVLQDSASATPVGK